MSTQSGTNPIAVPTVSKLARRRTFWITSGVVSAVVLASVWLAIRNATPDEPRLNADTVSLARFVHGRGFDALSFDKQRQLYKVLDDRDKELDDAFKAGQLSEAQYRNALEAAWLGKHLNQVGDYFSLPPGQARANYVDQLVTKKLKPKDDKKEAGKNAENEIRKDETAAELRVESWPPAIRDQWKQFHTAYRNEKKRREKASTSASGF